MAELDVRSYMKFIAATLAMLAISQLRADPSEAAQRFLAVDNADWSSSALNEEQFQKSSFPEGLWSQIEGYFHGITDRETFVGYKHDLNGDGVSEFFIETPFGGSGGPHFTLLTLTNKGWQEIGIFQGGFHLIEHSEGWSPIVGYARGGADSYYKFLLEFDGTGYKEVWAANFSGAKIIQKEIEQGAAANP